MNIGFDIQPLQTPSGKTGIGRYVSNLVAHLRKCDDANRYRFFLSRNFPPPDNVSHFEDGENLCYFDEWPVLRRYSWIWKEARFQALMRRSDVEVYHANSLGEDIPIITPRGGSGACRVVITVHDLIPLLFKETLTSYWPRGFLRYDFGRRLKNLEAADAIIAVSYSTKKDIVRHLSIDPTKIHVIYGAVEQKFRVVNDIGIIEDVRKRYGLPEKYILNVGGGFFDPRKNLTTLIDAFHHLRTEYELEEYVLVLCGDLCEGATLKHVYKKMEERDLYDCVILPGYVNDEDLPALYSGASVFVYPSLYEGFGLPVLEAMACGVPVVTSDVSSLPEVVGNAAVLVEPGSAHDIAEGIVRILQNSALKNELVAKGLERAQFFCWGKTARETINVYEKVC